MQFNKPKPEQSFVDNVLATRSMRIVIEGNRCPACTQQTLKLTTYITGPKGWEATVACENCNFTGVANQMGFDFKRVNSKGKARE
jgi:hypothetical protein